MQDKAIKSQSDFELKYGLLKAVIVWGIKDNNIVYKDVNDFGQFVSLEKIIEDFELVKSMFKNKEKIEEQTS